MVNHANFFLSSNQFTQEVFPSEYYTYASLQDLTEVYEI